MLVSLILGLVILGVALYLVGVIPMDAPVKTIIRVLIVVAALVWLLQMAGVRGLG